MPYTYIIAERRTKGKGVPYMSGIFFAFLLGILYFLAQLERRMQG